MKEMIAGLFKQNIPFSQTVGVEFADVQPGLIRARLPHRVANHNHVQTIHAGAQFTLAESAAGAAVMGTFADLSQSATILVTHSSIKYLAPAAGTLEAVAVVSEELQTEVRNALQQPGDRIRFNLKVVVRVEGAENVSTEAEFGWYFKLNG